MARRARGGRRKAEGPTPLQLPAPPVKFALAAAPKRAWWRNYKIMIAVWLVMIGLTWFALQRDVDKAVIAGSVVAVGLVSNAFAWLLGILSLVPVVGPLIVKALSIGFIWLLNGVGYLVSFVAIKRGYSKDVLTYRGLTIAVIVGIVIGFIIGKLV